MTDITFLDGGLGQEINNRATQDSAHPALVCKGHV